MEFQVVVDMMHFMKIYEAQIALITTPWNQEIIFKTFMQLLFTLSKKKKKSQKSIFLSFLLPEIFLVKIKLEIRLRVNL